jgi:hypothetical protein
VQEQQNRPLGGLEGEIRQCLIFSPTSCAGVLFLVDNLLKSQAKARTGLKGLRALARQARKLVQKIISEHSSFAELADCPRVGRFPNFAKAPKLTAPLSNRFRTYLSSTSWLVGDSDK